MERQIIAAAIIAAVFAIDTGIAAAQHEGHHPQLHVNPRWDECAFQLDPSLTQEAWRQFTREAGMVTYFRPLRDARAMGAGNVEVAIVQSTIGIDDHDAAWNDTFVHPDSTHWLFDGSGLPVPGVLGRVGVTDRLDVGAYFTKNPNSNYGFAGAQAQYQVLGQESVGVDAAVRGSMVTLFGPEDLSFQVYGLDIVASRQFRTFASWLTVAPYVSTSGYLARSHEKTRAVALDDERVLGAQTTVGVVAQVSVARIAFEYNTAAVNSRSIKVAIGF